MSYQTVAHVSELADSGQLHVNIDGIEILLCKDDDEYFAVSYFCSHETFTLEGGSIHNKCITCPYHGAEFDLKTGDALTPPAWEAIKTYPVKVEDELISIAVSNES